QWADKDFFLHAPPVSIFAFCICLIYLMTLSAWYSTDCGIVRPICFAVLRLITNSNFVGCSTGRSAGFAPLRILSTNVADRRFMSRRLGPYTMRPPSSTYDLQG